MYVSDLKHPRPSLAHQLRQLYTLNRSHTLDLSFRPCFLTLLEKMGHPERRLPPVIHVAGTNGKGSVIAFLRAMLESAGYTVHTYTSPHLVQFNERIVLQGKPIDHDALEHLIHEALRLNAGGDISFFEITTALAFQAFAQTPADLCLLEVGLGGRLDCTNIVESPVLTLINTIGYDHMEFLGQTLPEIAAEKAGIMKPAVPCVIGHQNAPTHATDIRPVFESLATRNTVPLFFSGQDSHLTPTPDGLHFSFQNSSFDLPYPALTGPHQIRNLETALTALHLVRDSFPVSHTARNKAVRSVFWPARLQKLCGTAYGLPKDWELWLDGGHNADAGQALAAQAALWDQEDGKALHLIVGMMAHKNVVAFLEPLRPFYESLTFVDIPSEPKALSAQTLQSLIPWGKTQKDIRTALCAIAKKTQKPARGRAVEIETGARILICGSLYLAGDVLRTSQN